MPVAYMTRSYLWLPREDEAAWKGTSPYQPVPAGGAYYYTDLRKIIPTGHGYGNFYYNLALPNWFPQKVLINQFLVGWPASANTEINLEVFVDVKGIFATSANGAEVGSDFSRCIEIMQTSKIPGDKSYQDRVFLKDPIPLDRATDHFSVTMSNNLPIDWLQCTIGFLVPVPTALQPANLGPNY